MTDCDSNGLEWTPVGHIMVTVVSTVAGCKADGQGSHDSQMKIKGVSTR